VAFSSDGKLLASGSTDRTIKLWDVASGQHKASLQGPTGAVHSVAFSSDGKLLASGSGEFGKPGEIKLWGVTIAREQANAAKR
jgi:WD40 repeat protein